MSIVDLVSKKRQPTQIGSLALDCLIREVHGMRNRVTDYPVEGGATIADHIANEPRELQVEGLISNSPIVFITDRIRQLARGEGEKNYAELAFQELERIHREKVLVDIKGRFKTYKAMALVSLDVDRTQRTGNALEFTSTWRQMKTVDVQRVALPTKPTKKENAQPRRDKGKQPTAAATPAAEKRVTILKGWARGFGVVR